MKNLIFCFPYRGVGGVSLLFLRMAEYLVSRVDFNIFCIDYEDGFISKNLSNHDITMIFYSDDKMVTVPEDSMLIFQTMTPWTIFPNIKILDGCKLFFWNCHPYNLVPHIPIFSQSIKKNAYLNKIILKAFFPTYWLKCKNFLKLLIDNNAIAFMDSSNKDNTQLFYFPIPNKGFLPIPSEVIKPRKNYNCKDPCHLLWVGRIVDFKYYILIHTLRKVDNYAKLQGKDNIVFTIVGGGDFLARLKENCLELSHIKVDFIEFMSPQHLNVFMREKVDLVFAMGTSALDAARLGIPTVLLDIAYSPITEGYSFKFLFEGDGASLGAIIKPKISFSRRSSSVRKNIDNIFVRLLDDYEGIAVKTRKYYVENHSIKKVSDNFLKRIQCSSLLYGDLRRSNCLSRGLVYSLKQKFKL
jgi:hypothetical protein